MDLNAPQRQQLQDALLDAFPRWSALKQTVDYGLDENLEKIAGNSNLSDAVHELITWARARDRIEELISTALRFNPSNVQLGAFAQQVGITLDTVTKKDKVILPPQPPSPLPELRTPASPQTPTGINQGTTLPQSPTTVKVIPLRAELPLQQPPAHVTLPNGYRYLGKLEEGLSTEHLYRERDGHIALWFPAQPGVLSPFLIDKYAVTVQQVCVFLNDAVSQGLVSTDTSLQNGVTCCRDRRGRVVALDAQGHWQCTPMQFRPVSPWG